MRRVTPIRLLLALLAVPMMYGQSIQTVTQTLSATVNPASTFVSVPGSITLTEAVGNFQPFVGTLLLTYQARSTFATGGGSITVQASTDFAPTGGPSIAAGALTYTCSGATLGTNCSGPIVVSTATATNVVTLPAAACGGGGVCSNGNDPQQVTLGLTVKNSPAYATGTYTATLLFTISST